MDPRKEPGIVISQIYLESVDFSHREDALTLPPSTPAAIGDVGVAVTVAEVAGGENGLVRMVIETRPDSKPLYNVRLSMVGLVTRQKGQENMTMREFLSTSAPALLYPFLREAFANITTRGRFGPVWLHPINVILRSTSFRAIPWTEAKDGRDLLVDSLEAPKKRTKPKPAPKKRALRRRATPKP